MKEIKLINIFGEVFELEIKEISNFTLIKGHYYTVIDNYNLKYTFIFKNIINEVIYSHASTNHKSFYARLNTSIINLNEIKSIKYATNSECNTLINAINKKGYMWDDNKKELITYKWRAKKGETFYYIDAFGEIIKTIELDVRSDEQLHRIGNYFKNREDAIKSSIYQSFNI